MDEEQISEPVDGEATIDFISFTASLATNALAALGALPDGEGDDLPCDNPELARQYIDILSMLQRKTVGNLSEHEESALRQILSDLRMAYVRCTEGK